MHKVKYIKLFENFGEVSQFGQLIGKIIEKVYISNDKSSLIFETEDSEFHHYTAFGDCCNSVWFSHFNGIYDIIHQKVQSVESKDWMDVDGGYIGDDSCEESCMWTLSTNRGRIDIEVRNSHNGYYGGSVSHSLADGVTPLYSEIIEDF